GGCRYTRDWRFICRLGRRGQSNAIGPMRDRETHGGADRQYGGDDDGGEPQAAASARGRAQKAEFGMKIRRGRPVRTRVGHCSTLLPTSASSALMEDRHTAWFDRLDEIGDQ